MASNNFKRSCQPNRLWRHDASNETSVTISPIGALMQYEFRRVAIVNRGEAAMRFIHAAREFSQEHGVPLRTIALFTEPDRHAMFVREADEAASLGPAQFTDPDTHRPKCSYLDYKRLEQAMAAARV